MSIPFVDRHPNQAEIERFRLILSTYQDGTGMLVHKNHTLPGWRDFERSVAVAFDGKAMESKWIYDVLLSDSSTSVHYGVSCKMRETLKTAEKTNRVTIELSNASGEFWDVIKTQGLTQETYHTNPELVGESIVQVVEGWYQNVAGVNHHHSFYLVLQWDRITRRYQLFQYPIDLPTAPTLAWEVTGRRLIGKDTNGIVLEWYGFSGGQLKYYPQIQSAIWKSAVFQLEPLPPNLESGIKQKAAAYFPILWEQTESSRV